MKRDRSKDAPKTAAELMAELRQDPEFVRGERARAEKQDADVKGYTEAATGILDELRRVGFSVSAVGELRSGRRYKKAIPILLSWLGRVADEHIKEDIIRTLSVPWAKEAGPALVAEYRRTAGSLRWAIANALEVLASDEIFNDLVELALDREGGQARQMLALAVAKTKSPDAKDALMQMLGDEEIAGHALSGLAKLKADVPRTVVEPFLEHSAAWVRKEAKKLL
jgi:hypothetical protein